MLDGQNREGQNRVGPNWKSQNRKGKNRVSQKYDFNPLTLTVMVRVMERQSDQTIRRQAYYIYNKNNRLFRTQSMHYHDDNIVVIQSSTRNKKCIKKTNKQKQTRTTKCIIKHKVDVLLV